MCLKISTRAHATTCASTSLGRAPRAGQNAVRGDGMPRETKKHKKSEGAGEDEGGREAEGKRRGRDDAGNLNSAGDPSGSVQEKPKGPEEAVNDHEAYENRERLLECTRGAWM